jgi:hypothetical protein
MIKVKNLLLFIAVLAMSASVQAAPPLVTQEMLTQDLIDAIEAQNYDDVIRVLGRDVDGVRADINGDGLCAAAGHTIWMTPLMAACAVKNMKLIKLLLSRSANVNGASRNKVTALMISAIVGYYDGVKYLLARGASVDAQQNEGETALILACINGKTKIAQLLLEAGAHVNHVSPKGITPLLCSILSPNYTSAMFVLLLFHGVRLPDNIDELLETFCIRRLNGAVDSNIFRNIKNMFDLARARTRDESRQIEAQYQGWRNHEKAQREFVPQELLSIETQLRDQGRPENLIKDFIEKLKVDHLLCVDRYIALHDGKGAAYDFHLLNEKPPRLSTFAFLAARAAHAQGLMHYRVDPNSRKLKINQEDNSATWQQASYQLGDGAEWAQTECGVFWRGLDPSLAPLEIAPASSIEDVMLLPGHVEELPSAPPAPVASSDELPSAPAGSKAPVADELP